MSHFYHEKWHQEEFIVTAAGIGSNCWTVHGNLTASGKPYFSCDPHLNKQLQSMWYLVGVSWKEDLDKTGNSENGFIVGGSVPGLPLFTYGRSAAYSWGATALNPDNTDLYVEKIEGNKYLFDGEWHELKTVRETFKVRMGEDVVYDFKFTHHGALLYKPTRDDLGFSVWFPLEFLNQNNDLNYSIRWVYGEDVPNKIYSMSKELVSLNPDLEKLEQFLENQNMFPLNMNFVTSKGDIGYHMTGLFPKRKYMVGHGVYPKKGWMKENLWQGFVSPKEHPRLYNPK